MPIKHLTIKDTTLKIVDPRPSRLMSKRCSLTFKQTQQHQVLRIIILLIRTQPLQSQVTLIPIVVVLIIRLTVQAQVTVS